VKNWRHWINAHLLLAAMVAPSFGERRDVGEVVARQCMRFHLQRQMCAGTDPVL
jgi:hypothetical protein